MKKLRFIAAFLCLLMINVTPVKASEPTAAPKVIDEANLLTDEEETKLTTKINEIVDKHQIDIAIATEHDKTASTIQDEADLMYDNNGYGIGDSKDGILFLVAKDPGEWAISTTGNAIGLFSDTDLDRLGGNAATEYFSDGEFYRGFDSYLSELGADLESTLNNESAATPETDDFTSSAPEASTTTSDTNVDEKAKTEPSNHLIPSLIAGLVIAIISMSVTKSGMKTANMQNNANAYQQKNAASNIRKKDIFLTTSITKRPIPKDDNKQHRSSGTTTVHRSSNGHSHGGRSGKF